MEIAVYGATKADQDQVRSLPIAELADFRFVDSILSMQTMDTAKDCIAVSLLSNSAIGPEEAKALKDCGVKYISGRGAGIDHLNLAALKEAGIIAANVPSYSPATISEHCIMLLLSLARRMTRGQKMVREGNYKVNGILGREVASMTVGVIGTGRIGSITVKSVSAFGSCVLMNDVYENPDLKAFGEYVPLEKLLSESDAVLLHCPLFESNYHMISKESLAMMKDGAFLVNAARGGLVDTEAVLSALESGKLDGFAFDAYEGEDPIVRVDFQGKPTPDTVFNAICERDDVIYTPHIAFYTEEAARELMRISMDNLYQLIKTGKCKNQI